jgi:hypothetical protein
MYQDDVVLKQQAEKGIGSAAPSPYTTEACTDQGTATKQAPLGYRLQHTIRRSEREFSRAQRALYLLEKHPEFEELLELLEISRQF